MTWKDKIWDKMEKVNHSKAVDKAWEYGNKLGAASNKLAGKLGVEAFAPTELAMECEKAARILRTFTLQGVATDPTAEPEAGAGAGVGAATGATQTEKSDYGDKYASRKTQKVIKKIPERALAEAKGIAIFTVFRFGIGFSGAGGSGVMLRRLEDGSWSPPIGLLMHILSVGWLAGADVYDCVMILRTDAAVRAFMAPQVKLGAELAVAAGPVGNGFTLDSNLRSKPAWTYTKSKGLYGGIQLDGNIIVIRTDENARFYHTPEVTAKDILEGRFPWPQGAGPAGLRATILAAEGKASAADLAAVPQGEDPSDTVLPHSDDPEAEKQMHGMQDQMALGAQGSEETAPTTTQGRRMPPPPPDRV